MGTTTKSGYCVCGGAAVVSSSPPGLAEGVIAAFEQLHQGEGHGPATPRQARAARAKADRELLEDDRG